MADCHMYHPRKAVEKLGVHPNTLRRYADEGQIETIRTKAGQRLFNGSGLNFKSKGLRSLLDRLMRADQLEIVVACQDRLPQFGFELIQYLAEQNSGKILVLDSPEYCP